MTTTRRRTTRRNDMPAAEVRKLAKQTDSLLASMGFVYYGKHSLRDWCGWSSRFKCAFYVTVYTDDGHPWLACCYDRQTGGYEDIPHANRYTGKFNCHIFDRMTAEEALSQFRNHLEYALGASGPGAASVPEVAQ